MRHGHDGTVEAHPEAHDYIEQLVMDCQSALDKRQQPRISPSQLQAWYQHQRDLMSCGTPATYYNWDSVTPRLTLVESPHEPLVERVVELITTLKLLNEGYDGYQVTQRELDEIRRLAGDLPACRKRIVWYR